MSVTDGGVLLQERVTCKLHVQLKYDFLENDLKSTDCVFLYAFYLGAYEWDGGTRTTGTVFQVVKMSLFQPF